MKKMLLVALVLVSVGNMEAKYGSDLVMVPMRSLGGHIKGHPVVAGATALFAGTLLYLYNSSMEGSFKKGLVALHLQKADDAE